MYDLQLLGCYLSINGLLLSHLSFLSSRFQPVFKIYCGLTYSFFFVKKIQPELQTSPVFTVAIRQAVLQKALSDSCGLLYSIEKWSPNNFSSSRRVVGLGLAFPLHSQYCYCCCSGNILRKYAFILWLACFRPWVL